MDTGKRQHLQDIYATDQTSRDDFTPQVSAEMIEERKRDIRRRKFTGFMLGLTVLLLAVSLVYIIMREFMDVRTAEESPTAITQEYIPRYSLKTEAQWVLDFPKQYGSPKWDGEGERPFNAEWVKKAAFNLILAEQAVNLRKYDEAAKHYEQALEIVPDVEGVRIPLGMAYFRLEAYDKALELLGDVPETDLTFEVLNNLGAACIDAEKYEQGEDYLRRALELQPTYPEALKNLAVLYKETDEPSNAIDAYEKYFDQRPQDNDSRYDFALYLTKVGNWELAGEQLRLLTEEVTDVANLYLLLSRVETRLGNADAAIAALRRAARLTDPKQALLWMDDSQFDQLREDEDFQGLIQHYDK